uniref:Uncharacterized protein n=1 Tax=Anopheles minimus TaxID=112268 RepID=A0A182WNX2_9DIPT
MSFSKWRNTILPAWLHP